MSEKFLEHLQSEINFVEDKIIHLGGIITNAYHNEVKQYFTRQQDIAIEIKNELYNLAGLSIPQQVTTIAPNSAMNQTAKSTLR